MSEAVMKKLEAMHADIQALRKGQAAWLESAAATRARDAGRPAQVDRQQGGGILFPNYGRSKGMPVAGAARGDLDFYRNGCERSLNDPSKARWHDKERLLLEAIDAEIARQEGGTSDSLSEEQQFAEDEKRRALRALEREVAYTTGQSDEPPPHDDDDAPF